MKRLIPSILLSAILAGCTSTQTSKQMTTIPNGTMKALRENLTKPREFSTTNSPPIYTFKELPKTEAQVYTLDGTNVISTRFVGSGIANDAHQSIETAHRLEELLSPAFDSEGAFRFKAEKDNKPIIMIDNYALPKNSGMQISLRTKEGRRNQSELEITFGVDNTEFKTRTTKPVRATSVALNLGIGYGVANIPGVIGVAAYETLDLITTKSSKPIGRLSRTISPLTADLPREAMLATFDESQRYGLSQLIVTGYSTPGKPKGSAVVYISSELQVGTPYMVKSGDLPRMVIPITSDSRAVKNLFIGMAKTATRWTPNNKETRTIYLPSTSGGERISGSGARNP